MNMELSSKLIIELSKQQEKFERYKSFIALYLIIAIIALSITSPWIEAFVYSYPLKRKKIIRLFTS